MLVACNVCVQHLEKTLVHAIEGNCHILKSMHLLSNENVIKSSCSLRYIMESIALMWAYNPEKNIVKRYPCEKKKGGGGILGSSKSPEKYK